MIRHAVVDLSGKLDEARMEVKLFGFPRKIERINRNAVPAETWAGIEGVNRGSSRSTTGRRPILLRSILAEASCNNSFG